MNHLMITIWEVNCDLNMKRGIGIVITIWNGMTIQGLYFHLDMGNNTVTYHKCSHVQNLKLRFLAPYRFAIVHNLQVN